MSNRRDRRAPRWPTVGWGMMGLLIVSAGYAYGSGEPPGTKPTAPPNASSLSSSQSSEIRNDRRVTVGMPGRIEALVLPAPMLEVIPRTDKKQSIVLRIVDVTPHGNAFRYDLEYYGLDPGEFDLVRYLRGKDGAQASSTLPPVLVTIAPLRPPGQIEPNVLVAPPQRPLGGYRTWGAAVGLLWIAGLVLILLARRDDVWEQVRRRGLRRLTPAERLQPLVAQALAGQLHGEQRGELERALLAYWMARPDAQPSVSPASDRENNAEPGPVRRLQALKAHPQAGPVLMALEAWLHRPEAEGSRPDPALVRLLEPYLDMPAFEATLANHSASVPESSGGPTLPPTVRSTV